MTRISRHFNISRRGVLRGSAAVGFTSATGLLGAMSTQAADTSGYKALVCLFLGGGNDAADTVIPTDQASFDALKAQRVDMYRGYGEGSGTSSRDRENLLALNSDRNFEGRTFGLPRELKPIHELYTQGRMAVVGNVGPLVMPVTRSQMDNNTVETPARLFSHNDQQSQWMSMGVEGANFGWGGQFADRVAPNSGAGRTFTSVTAGRPSGFLNALQTRQYPARAEGSVYLRSIRQEYWLGRDSGAARDALREHFASQGVTSSNMLVRDLASANARTITDNATFDDAIANAVEFTTVFPSTKIGEQLAAIANVISVRGALGTSRQLFYAQHDGYDTHESQVANLPTLHSELADAMRAFDDAMVELGLGDSVTLFTASDFGRTIQVNGAGTDHGWGGHHFVMGGAVRGGNIYGSIPEYDLGSQAYTSGRARTIPDMSVDQYAASLGKWFGLAGDELRDALPNLGNFDGVPDLFGLGGSV